MSKINFAFPLIIFIIIIIIIILTIVSLTNKDKYTPSNKICSNLETSSLICNHAFPYPDNIHKDSDGKLLTTYQSNDILKNWFECEDYYQNDNGAFPNYYYYLDDPNSTYTAFNIAKYDFKQEKVISNLPYNFYKKILYQKLSTKNDPNTLISVIIAQSVIQLKNIPESAKDIQKALYAYHTSILFVESSKYKQNNNKLDNKDILFSLELWAEGGNQVLGLASCLYPYISNGKVDKYSQSYSVINIQYPEAFGCTNDGSYWNYDNLFYIGETKASNIEKLYDHSVQWLSNNWGYIGGAIVNSECSSAIPNNPIIANTCDSYGQSVCLFLDKIDPNNFKDSITKLPWTDMEIIGEYTKIDLSDVNFIKIFDNYKEQINKIIYSLIPNKNNIIDYFDNLSKNYGNINNIINDLAKQMSTIYTCSFNGKDFDLYSIKLTFPYVRNVYSTCPGLMYKKYGRYIK